MEEGKIPPQDVEMEKAIIATLLRYNQNFTNVNRYIKPECFYKLEHQHIYRAISDLALNDKPYDSTAVINQLRRVNKLDECGGVYYITSLSILPSCIDLKYSCLVVFEMYVRRAMIEMFHKGILKLYDYAQDIEEIKNAIIEQLEALYGNISIDMVHSINLSIERALNDIRDIANGSKIAWYKTGDQLVDNLVYLTNGSIVAITSARSAGKSRYLLKLIDGLFCNNKDIACLWYSGEDTDTKIVQRFASMRTTVTEKQMQQKGYTITDDDMAKIEVATKEFASWDISIQNSVGSINAIASTFKKFRKKRKNKLNILAIDNIMLVKELNEDMKANSNQTSIEDKVAVKIRNIMDAALEDEQQCVIIFLHHMTKEMESKANSLEAYRPKLSHIKGSSRFTDIASNIILLNKPGMHKDLLKRQATLPNVKCVYSDNSIKPVPRKKLLEAMIIAEVAKNRDGEVTDDEKAVCRYICDFNNTKFTPLKTVR